MRLLEYEAKALLKQAGISVPAGSLLQSPSDTSIAPTVVKSQVPAGGRGKAGGVRIVKTDRELSDAAHEIFTLPIAGYLPKVLLAEEVLSIKHEYYLSLLIDNAAAEIQLMAHGNGGVEVEDNDAKSFFTAVLDGTNAEAVGEQLADYFNLSSHSFALQDMVEQLRSCFIKNDATLLEINPLILTTDSKLVAGDCKMELDDAAFFRHPDWNFEDKPHDANFVILHPNGNVASIANGAGLAMATVDAIAAHGMMPANFLDIGGGATTASVLHAFHRFAELSNVKVIVINIFAGITRCDEVARAIIEAKKALPNLPPLCIRLSGTNFKEAVALLEKEAIAALQTLEECLEKAKELSRE